MTRNFDENYLGVYWFVNWATIEGVVRDFIEGIVWDAIRAIEGL